MLCHRRWASSGVRMHANIIMFLIIAELTTVLQKMAWDALTTGITDLPVMVTE